jgi:hypothetical protein
MKSLLLGIGILIVLGIGVVLITPRLYAPVPPESLTTNTTTVSNPPAVSPPTGGPPTSTPTTISGSRFNVPAEFHGPTANPHIKGPSGPPPNY